MKLRPNYTLLSQEDIDAIGRRIANEESTRSRVTVYSGKRKTSLEKEIEKEFKSVTRMALYGPAGRKR